MTRALATGHPMRRLLASLVLLTPLRGQAAKAPPHIVLVMADDQGWGDVGYNGHAVCSDSGTIDAMAKCPASCWIASTLRPRCVRQRVPAS